MQASSTSGRTAHPIREAVEAPVQCLENCALFSVLLWQDLEWARQAPRHSPNECLMPVVQSYSESFDARHDLAGEHIAVLERLLYIGNERLNFPEQWEDSKA